MLGQQPIFAFSWVSVAVPDEDHILMDLIQGQRLNFDNHCIFFFFFSV